MPRAGADVPLAGHEGGVTGGPENLGEGGGAAVQLSFVSGERPGLHHVADARLVRVEAGEQGGAGGAAAGGVVEAGETEAVFREGVEVRGLDLAAVAADVGPAQVIGEDDDDVRLFGGVEERGGEQEGGEDGKAEVHGGYS